MNLNSLLISARNHISHNPTLPTDKPKADRLGQRFRVCKIIEGYPTSEYKCKFVCDPLFVTKLSHYLSPAMPHYSTLSMQCSVIGLLRRYLSNTHERHGHHHNCTSTRMWGLVAIVLPSPHHTMPNEIHITNSIKIKMEIIHNSKAITTELLKLSCEYEFRALHPSLLIQRNLCNSTSYLLLSLLLLLVVMFICPLIRSLTISLLRSFCFLFSLHFLHYLLNLIPTEKM